MFNKVVNTLSATKTVQAPMTRSILETLMSYQLKFSLRVVSNPPKSATMIKVVENDDNSQYEL